MSEENYEYVEEPTDRLTLLKERADTMGIKYHHKANADTISNLIEKALGESEKTDNTTTDTPSAVQTADILLSNNEHIPQEYKPLNEGQRKSELLKQARKNVRCIVTCHNPAKSSSTGEFHTVANGIVPKITTMVQYNVETHVPQIILNMLRERTYEQFYTYKEEKTGDNLRRSRTIKEYSIQVLDPLTEKELQVIRERQISRNSVGDS